MTRGLELFYEFKSANKVYTHPLTLKELLKTAEKKWDEIDILDAQENVYSRGKIHEKGLGSY